MTMLVLVAVLGAALQSSSGGLDEVHRKDGRVHKGLILSEEGDRVQVILPQVGSKGALFGVGTIKVPKADVDRIVRAHPQDRKRWWARVQAFDRRWSPPADAVPRVKDLGWVTEDGRDWSGVQGTRFKLLSSCTKEFTRKVAESLEQLFSAYEKVFKVRRDGGSVIRVFLLPDRATYDRFQKRRFGGAVMNPAFYSRKGNYIACFNMVQVVEEHKATVQIKNLKREIDQYRSNIRMMERKVDRAAEEIQSAIRTIKDPRERLDKLVILRRDEEELKGLLAERRREAEAAIKELEKAIVHNKKVLSRQNRGMFEMLYHEAFHAFAENHLWETKGGRDMPMWLHEGLASYFEMGALEGRLLIHGAPHREFLAHCKQKAVIRALMPVSRILGAGREKFVVVHRDQAKRSGDYYAHSWALAHYVMMRLGSDRLAPYVEAIMVGKDPVVAFEEAMGKKCSEVDAELSRYLIELK